MCTKNVRIYGDASIERALQSRAFIRYVNITMRLGLYRTRRTFHRDKTVFGMKFNRATFVKFFTRAVFVGRSTRSARTTCTVHVIPSNNVTDVRHLVRDVRFTVHQGWLTFEHLCWSAYEFFSRADQCRSCRPNDSNCEIRVRPMSISVFITIK